MQGLKEAGFSSSYCVTFLFQHGGHGTRWEDSDPLGGGQSNKTHFRKNQSSFFHFGFVPKANENLFQELFRVAASTETGILTSHTGRKTLNVLFPSALFFSSMFLSSTIIAHRAH